MMREGKFGVAEYAFREATQLNANSALSHFYHAQALIELALRGKDERQSATDLNAADKELDRAWELSERRWNPVYLQRARIHEKRGQKEAAARDLESYLKAEPAEDWQEESPKMEQASSSALSNDQECWPGKPAVIAIQAKKADGGT